ncbi:MAG TPA: nuclear transport factor 2 family protein [Terracidiphilus sp.]|jgi:ketosteroid isomerase-like protein|nr:nuclear transport factor 2 family protein [Terracidiphilus sp.]
MELQEFVPAMIRFAVCFCVALLSASALAQSPAASPASATSAAASTDSTEVGQFQKIENSWSESINARDQYALELVLSPLFVDVSASGDITTRNQQLADVIGNEDKTLHLDQRVITVRMLGDTAVANGTYVLHHKTQGGAVDEKGVFTHVYQRVRNGWVCINSQRTSVRAEMASGKQKKPSNAEQPFHIPLFSRSDKSTQQ